MTFDSIIRFSFSTEPMDHLGIEAKIADACRKCKQVPKIAWFESPLEFLLSGRKSLNIGGAWFERVPFEHKCCLEFDDSDQTFLHWARFPFYAPFPPKPNWPMEFPSPIYGIAPQIEREEVIGQINTIQSLERLDIEVHDRYLTMARQLEESQTVGSLANINQTQTMNLLTPGNACCVLSTMLGQCLFRKGTFCVIDRPEFIRFDNNGRLHCWDGPAISFRDGSRAFYFRGLPVREGAIDSKNIGLQEIFNTPNTEWRGILLERFGLERVLSELGGYELDSRDNYKLYNVVLPRWAVSMDVPEMRLLSMKNPSTGTTHIESVHPECLTVQQALNWRVPWETSRPWKPEVLT